MKTAISIPDEIYERAERLARQTKRSRSKLFSDALDEYLVGEVADPLLQRAARRRLQDTEW